MTRRRRNIFDFLFIRLLVVWAGACYALVHGGWISGGAVFLAFILGEWESYDTRRNHSKETT